MPFLIVLNFIIGFIDLVIGFILLNYSYYSLGLIWLIQAPFNFYIAGENFREYRNYDKTINVLSYRQKLREAKLNKSLK